MALVNSKNVTAQVPQQPQQDNLMSGKKDLQKTKLCIYYAQGTCGLGSDCKFAHSASEIRSAPSLAKTQLCVNFMNGKCTNMSCSYAHGEAELVSPPSFKSKMCHWHMQGKCRNGANCRFAHNSADIGCSPGTKPLQVCKIEADQKSPPWLFAKTVYGDDGDASTVPSSTDAAMNDATPMPDAGLHRMVAGRGAAPLQNQVASMGLAIGDLQAKLEQIETKMSGTTQVGEMHHAIKQLSEQHKNMQEHFRGSQNSARATMQRLAHETTKHAAQAVEPPLLENASTSALGSSSKPLDKTDSITSKGPRPPAKKVRQNTQSLPMEQPKAIGRCHGKKMMGADWWEKNGVRSALGALILALMVMVELYK